jgi:hypothetical protein
VYCRLNLRILAILSCGICCLPSEQ